MIRSEWRENSRRYRNESVPDLQPQKWGVSKDRSGPNCATLLTRKPAAAEE